MVIWQVRQHVRYDRHSNRQIRQHGRNDNVVGIQARHMARQDWASRCCMPALLMLFSHLIFWRQEFVVADQAVGFGLNLTLSTCPIN